MLVESRLPVAAKSLIQVRFPKLIVFGEVTFCHRSESSFRIGIAITDVASVHGLQDGLQSDQIESLACPSYLK